VGIELSPAYVAMSEKRLRSELGMLAEVNIAAQRSQGGGENLKEK
jgi:hypothetical protein